MQVHIVEDDLGVNESLQFLLQTLGHSVLAYQDAMSFFDAAPPIAGDLVIVDLGLPLIDGVSVIRWLQRLYPAPKVVAISGQSQRLIDKALGSFNAVTVLRKPLNGDSLVPLLA